jgi:hypothetical protein
MDRSTTRNPSSFEDTRGSLTALEGALPFDVVLSYWIAALMGRLVAAIVTTVRGRHY